MKCSIFY